jgi:hypothetical protein
MSIWLIVLIGISPALNLEALRAGVALGRWLRQRREARR